MAAKAPLFKPRGQRKAAPRFRKPCPCPPSRGSGCSSVVFLAAGMECPHCRLASLAEGEGNEIRCPVCGYGTHRPVT